MRWPPRTRRRAITIAAILVVVVGASAWSTFLREEPVRYATREMTFKYGTVGIEPNAGIPYWIWMVLPRVFPEYLPGPGGYASLGVVWEQGAEVPIGFSKMTVGFPRVGPNCALCHMGTYRTSPDAPTQLVPAGASSTFDSQAYLRFLFRSASDPRFTADVLMPEIEHLVKLSPADKALYREVLIPQTKKALLQTKQTYAWMEKNPDWGPGRIDPFNPVKAGILRRPVDGTIGNSDMMPIWALDEREGRRLHWDGLNGSIREVVLSSALGDGASRTSLDPAAMAELEAWLRKVQPPPYPFPVNRTLAAEGQQVYNAECSSCHGTPGAWTARLVTVAKPGEREGQNQIATDAYRIGMWDSASAETYNRYASGYDWKFKDFQDLDGYVAAPLNGIWTRAPYLHNGSVPTLWHLLRPTQRPERFYRGYDVLDTVHVGFQWTTPQESARRFFLYDTRLRGNSNRGHEYGSGLSEAQKAALLEYLKTL
jgi:hypothetical protein